MEDVQLDLSEKLIVICGPTASGKTSLAVACARKLRSLGIESEIISADSRQVYIGMDIGTGKDIEEYGTGEERIPTWCLDLVSPQTIFTLADFLQEANFALTDIRSRGRLPIICGGTGLYIEALLKNYDIPHIPEDVEFRKKMMELSKDELKELLEKASPELFVQTDLDSKKRIVRALEIVKGQKANHSIPHADSTKAILSANGYPTKKTNPHPLILITRFPREELLERIDRRLDERLNAGMIAEIQKLIDDGVSLERLELFGMEYGHIGRYLFEGDSSEAKFKEMRTSLANSIHRLSKRQMTWFRGTERRGLPTHWIDNANFNETWQKISEYLNIID